METTVTSNVVAKVMMTVRTQMGGQPLQPLLLTVLAHGSPGTSALFRVASGLESERFSLLWLLKGAGPVSLISRRKKQPFALLQNVEQLF